MWCITWSLQMEYILTFLCPLWIGFWQICIWKVWFWVTGFKLDLQQCIIIKNSSLLVILYFSIMMILEFRERYFLPENRCTFKWRTHLRPIFPSHRNQSIGLWDKWIYSYLYDGNAGLKQDKLGMKLKFHQEPFV